MTRDSETVLHAADAACHRALASLWQELDAVVWEPLRAATEQALGAHQDVMGQVGFDGECPHDADEVRRRAAEYLTAVAEKVHPPLLEALTEGLPAQYVEEVVKEARARSRKACAELPSAAEMERGAMAAMPHDGAGRRLGRRLARALAVVSKGRSPRRVDVRSVAARHRARSLVRLEDAWREEATRLWSVWLADAERCWAAWAKAIFTTMAHEADPPEEEPTPVWQTVTDAATALHAGLEALLVGCPHRGLAEASQAELAQARSVLESDLSIAGTFLLNPGPVEEKSMVVDGGWARWQGEAAQRLQMYAALMAVFVGVRRARMDMAERFRGEVLDVWREETDAAGQALREVGQALKSRRPERQAEFDDARGNAEAVLEGLKTRCPSRAQLEVVARRVAGMGVGAVQASLRRVPATLVLHPILHPTPAPRRPPRATYTVGLQDLARQAFDTLRMERLRTSATPVVESGEALASALGEIGEIVAFGFTAARTELESEVEGGRDRALELAVEALGRAADSLAHATEPLEKALDELRTRVRDEATAGFGGLAARALADRMQGRLLDARSRLDDALAGLRRRAGPGVERRVLSLRVGWLRLLRALSRGVRWGRNLVAAEATGPTTATRTARSLAAAEEVVEALPLVYQHLFALEPLTDEGLLVGRDFEVAEVEGKWRRWYDADGVPLLVTGRRCSGVSSFFNALVSHLGQRGARPLHLVLDQRITTEAALASYLCEALGFEAATSMDDVASRILGAPEGELPDLFALEGLEHTYLRVPGGTDLLERLFTLMAETEPRIFWVGALTSSAWQVVKKAEPAAAAQVDLMELSALTAADIESAILLRHRRSGLSLTFEEPVEGRRILRRRVRRLRGTERHQQILQRDYFERLHRTSQNNLRLAFFQWLRSVDFSGGREGQLVVHPLSALDFSFLASLDLTQNFTIKALLEHQTLTLAEHDAIFRVTRQESYHVFESLGNRHIIEAVPRPDEDPAISEVKDDIRYRIRPLLIGGAASHLASRNIVH